MNIRYVVSIMAFWGRQSRLSMEQECDLLRTLGFGVELWPNLGGLDECQYSKRDWRRLASATEGMLVSMRSRNDNPSIEQWAEQIGCAKLLNANIVADLQSLRMRGKNADDGDFIAEVVGMAKDEGVRLCIETGPLDILKEIGGRFDSIYYCLDTGFAGCDEGHNFDDYVDALVKRTAHLHIADHNGSYDDHRPLGCSGGMNSRDLDYLLEALKKNDSDVVASFEMTPCSPVEMIKRSSHFLFDILGWPNRPPKLSDSHPH
jgi:sugar phosphate isomerase/epimerase